MGCRFCHNICLGLEQVSDTELELLSVKFAVAVTSVDHTPVIAEFDSDYVCDVNTCTCAHHQVEAAVLSAEILEEILCAYLGSACVCAKCTALSLGV